MSNSEILGSFSNLDNAINLAYACVLTQKNKLGMRSNYNGTV